MSTHPTNVHEYMVIGRSKPTAITPNPPIYRMRLFTSSATQAKSRFWYFVSKIHKTKKGLGEILAVHEIFEKRPLQVKNFAIALRAESRTATTNMYKEVRDVSRVGAISQIYKNMAGAHRVRNRSVQIMSVKAVPAKLTRRAATKQFHNSSVRFPLLRRRPIFDKATSSRFIASRPSTHH